ncbi:MAG: PepSY-like domain-containing protein [Chitinophagaceae bacterium]|nr:PepSY-like domain-containing protein [Chitinophagaceae bacterium]
MKKIFGFTAVFAFLLIFSNNTFAQFRKIPSEVTDAFSQKYPGAKEVEWKDKLSAFSAGFNLDDKHYLASFSNKGEWQNTEQDVEESELPAVIKDSYSKTKYADWQINKVTKIELTGNVVQYRIEIGSGDIKKRNLYFNTEGRLLKDKLTI